MIFTKQKQKRLKRVRNGNLLRAMKACFWHWEIMRLTRGVEEERKTSRFKDVALGGKTKRGVKIFSQVGKT